MGISLVFIKIAKNRKNHIRELNKKIVEQPSFARVKVIIYMEESIDIMSVADTVWRFANNFDPKRDHFAVISETSTAHMSFDGTRKTKDFDGFERDWPNILVSDDATISHIDTIWSSLGLGPLISSPSLKYKSQVYKGGAIASEP
jgi:4-hydroxy-3-polyprenylbenzoate decarboxylase